MLVPRSTAITINGEIQSLDFGLGNFFKDHPASRRRIRRRIVRGHNMKFIPDLAERIGKLLYNDENSDTTLVVEGERLPAHSLILTISSDYFRALLCGNMKESAQGEIVLHGVGLKGFKQLMSYIYTGHLKLEEADEDTILELLAVAHLYGFEKVQGAVAEHLHENLSIKNVCRISSEALRLGVEALSDACFRLLEDNPNEILESQNFNDFSANALRQVLSRDTFFAEEIKIFKAVERWCRERPRFEQESSIVLEEIRLPLIATKYLMSVVMDSGLFTRDQVWEGIRIKECCLLEVKHRGCLVRDENLMSLHEAVMHLGENSSGIQTSKPCIVHESGAMHSWSEYQLPENPVVTMELSKPFLINHISFELTNGGSLFVSVSTDLENWLSVCEISKDFRHSSKDVHFEPRVARYIRLRFSDRFDYVCVTTLGVFYKTNWGTDTQEPQDSEEPQASQGEEEKPIEG